MATEEEKAAALEAANKEITDKIDSIKDTPQFAAILNQHGITYHGLKAEEAGASFMGKAYRKVDDAMKAAGYKDKIEGVFTTDYATQLVGDYLALEKELSELRESSGKEKTQADKDKDELHLTRLEEANKKTEEALLQLKTITAKGKRQEISSELSSGADTVVLNPSMTANDVKAIKKGRIDAVIANSKEIDGKTIYYDSDGKEFANLNGIPMTAKEVGAFIFTDLAFKKTPGGGADGDNGGDKPHVEGDIWNIPNPSKYKTFNEFSTGFEKAMRSIGLTRSDGEKYTKKLSATYKHHYKEGLPGVNN